MIYITHFQILQHSLIGCYLLGFAAFAMGSPFYFKNGIDLIQSYILLVNGTQKLLPILLGINNDVSSLLVLIPHLLRNPLLGLRPHPLEHGRILEHGRHDHKANEGTPEVDLLHWHRSAVFVEHCHIVQSYVHGVFGVREVPSEHLSAFHLDCYDVVFGLVQ